MQQYRKRLIHAFLAASISLSAGTFLQAPVHAADVTQVADTLMKEYPDTMKQWTDTGMATTSQVKAFVNDVASKVEASGNVTEENIGQKFKDALQQVQDEGNHTNALIAAAIAFNIDPVSKEIPTGLLPMKEVIKREVLASNQTPGGAGGASGGAVQEPVITTPTVPPADPVFSDIDGHWAAEGILQLYHAGILKGTNGKAMPDQNITRAEFATFLVNLLQLTDTEEIAFKDADPNEWYYPNLAKAYHAGLIKGFGQDQIRPKDHITREQMAVMIYAALKVKGVQITSNDEVSFKDKHKVSSWAKEAIKAASSMGIINGFPDGTFDPQGKATRAQAAIMITHLMGK